MKDDIQRDVAEWLRFVKMDQNTACHLFESMHPQPLEIICFHCQQAAEKAINNLDASVEVCCSHKVVAVGFNTLCYDAERRGIKPSARIKALFILKEIEVIKIHDLAILLHKIETFFSVPVAVKNAGDDLTPFAATFRYPQSPDIDEALTRKALTDMETVITWCKEQIVLAGYEIE